MSRNGDPRNGFDEAVRYYRNARQILARCKVRQDIYADIKPVQEAFGTAWLAVDKAIKAALLQTGVPPRQIPRSWEALLAAAGKRLAVRNGKLVKLLNSAYHEVHIAGYYGGDLTTKQTVMAAFETARRVIETLSGRKIA